MKAENSICVEIENFLIAKETRYDFHVEDYNKKYKELLHEQQLTDDALTFDEKILVLKTVYDEEGYFSKKLDKLFINCLHEYQSFDEELKSKIRTTEILESMNSDYKEYFSSENVYKRKEELKKNLIAWSSFAFIALLSIGLSIFMFLTGFTIKTASPLVAIILGSIVSIVLLVGVYFFTKKWHLALGCVALILATLSIYILNTLAFEQGVTLLKYLGK